MRLKIYSVFDSAAGAYMNPWVAHTDALAIRAFTDAVLNDASMKRNMGDYTLFRIGEFNPSNGVLTPATVAENLGHARLEAKPLEFVRGEYFDQPESFPEKGTGANYLRDLSEASPATVDELREHFDALAKGEGE